MLDLLEQVKAIRQLPSPGRAEAIRLRARVSRKRLAKEVGCHPGTLFRWEKSQSQPRGEALVRYAQALAVLEAAEAEPVGVGASA